MQIIGHRGARGEAPENTLGGFHHLKSIGINAVEFDVRQLKDGHLIITHDANFLRTSGQSATVEETNLKQAQSHDHRHLWQDWQTPEPTPTLCDVLSICRDFAHIEVEVKSVANLEAAERLIQSLELELQGFEHNVTITSFDLQILKVLKSTTSTFKRGLLVELPFGEHAIDIAKQHDCCRIGWKDQLVNAALIKATLDADLLVSVWTVNDVERAKALRDFGVDGLITDYPTRMLQHL